MPDTFHPDVRQQIRYHRVTKRLSLRRLAALSGLSHSYIARIEKGGVHPSDQAVRTLAAALSFEPWANVPDACDVIASSKAMVMKDIYGDYAEAERLARRAQDGFRRLANPENHPCFPGYVVHMAFHALFEAIQDPVSPVFGDCIELLTPTVFIIGPSLQGFDYELHLVTTALYQFHKRDDAHGLRLLNRHLKSGRDESLIGFNRFLQGIVFHMDYRTQAAAYEAFSDAQTHFQKTNNFDRIMHIKIYMQIIALNIGDDSLFMKLYEELEGYARASGKISIYRQNRIHLLRHYMLSHDYDKATDLLETIKDSPYPEFHIYRIVAHYRKGEHKKAKSAVNALKRSGHFQKENHVLFAHAMETVLNEGIDSGASLERLKAFADAAIAAGDIKIITIGVELFMRTLEAHRQYKKAAQYSETMLHMLETAIREGERHEGLP